MAHRLGMPRARVQSYLKRHDLGPIWKGPGGSLDDEQVREMIEVRKMTQADAAFELGCHLASVERAVRRLGLQTARTGPRSADGHKQQWSGGRMLDKSGYVQVFAPLHPQAATTGYIREHRAMCELTLGRYLTRTEVVDHLDNHPWHNWPSNLRVFASNADHLRATLVGRWGDSPRPSLLGVLPSSRTTDQCPEELETLAQCPAETILAYQQFVLYHRPTPEHAHLARKQYLRSGPWSPVFPDKSTD